MGNQNLYFVFMKQDGSAKVIYAFGNGVTSVTPSEIVYTFANPTGTTETKTIEQEDIARLLNENNAFDINDYMYVNVNGSVEFNNVLDVALPTVTTQPVDTTVADGAQLDLIVAGTDYDSVQWYQDGEAIVGATSETYTVAVADSDDAGEYYCVLVDSLVNLKTKVVTVTVTA